MSTFRSWCTIDVVQMALEIWPPVCAYIFLIYIMCISFGIYRALGMQWRGAAVITAMLYVCTLPLVIYFAVWRHGGLVSQWHILPICYTFMNVALVLGYTCMDWERHANTIKAQLQQGEVDDKISQPAQTLPSEVTPLIAI